MKKFFNSNGLVSIMLMLLTALFGVGGNVMLAATTAIPEGEGGGSSNSGSGNPGVVNDGSKGKETVEGIATETYGRANADPDFYLNDVEKKIVKIRPFSTPVDQISRYASSRSVDSFVVKYYSVGTRPIKTKVTAQLAASQSSASAVSQYVLQCADPGIFSIDDTIRVVGVKAGYDNAKGKAYTASNGDYPVTNKTADLELVVVGKSTADGTAGMPIVYPMNGKWSDDTGMPTMIPSNIAVNTTLIRMGKACAETDMQTGRFSNTPKADLQYCQHFALQVEQSTFDKIAAKEVDWDFSDLEEDALYDMRLTQELSYMFGDMGYMTHTAKDGVAQWFTRGIWWQAGKDTPIGHKVTETTTDGSVISTVISDDDLVNMSQSIFVGAGTGNKRKVILCGSNVLAAFGKIKSEKYRMTGTYERWHLKFTEWNTGFGDLYIIHDELLDQNGMEDYAFCLDPEYLYKATHLSFDKNVLDLKSAGIRNTDANVLREVSALYLRYPNAHSRMYLAHKEA